MFGTLSVATLLPLLGALIVGFTSRQSRSVIKLITFAAVLISAGIMLDVLIRFNVHLQGMQFESHYDWITLPFANGQSALTIRYDLGIDGLSLPLALLTAVVSVLAVVAAWNVNERPKSFFIWLLMLISGLYGVFVAEDLFVFFFFLELTLIPMYFLLSGWGAANKRVATKFLIYRGFASVLLLIAFVGLGYEAANAANLFTLDIPSIVGAFHSSSAHGAITLSARYGLFAILFVAILIEEAFFPFHTWLPDTHEHAHPAVSMLVGGVLMKIGAYILLRIGVGILPDAVARYGRWIALLGIINILYGALVALAQKDLRRLVAFGTISHMGIVLLAVASLTAAGIQGSMLMIVSSGLLSGLLFFVLGLIQARTNTLKLPELGGLSKSMPIISGVLLAGALGSLGLPGMSGFIAEILSFIGGFAKYPVLAAIGTAGIVLAAVYLLWAVQRTTFGQMRGTFEQANDATALDAVPLIVFLALIILVGVYPASVGSLVNGAIQTYLGIGG